MGIRQGRSSANTHHSNAKLLYSRQRQSEHQKLVVNVYACIVRDSNRHSIGCEEIVVSLHTEMDQYETSYRVN